MDSEYKKRQPRLSTKSNHALFHFFSICRQTIQIISKNLNNTNNFKKPKQYKLIQNLNNIRKITTQSTLNLISNTFNDNNFNIILQNNYFNKMPHTILTTLLL